MGEERPRRPSTRRSAAASRLESVPAGCGLAAAAPSRHRGIPGGGADAPSHGAELTPSLAMRLGTAWLDPLEHPRRGVGARPDRGTVAEPRKREEGRRGVRVSAAAAAAGQSDSETSEGPETRTLRPSAAWDARV